MEKPCTCLGQLEEGKMGLGVVGQQLSSLALPKGLSGDILAKTRKLTAGVFGSVCRCFYILCEMGGGRKG